MPALYTSVDIFVLPSYREGLPKSLLEAAACGVALVASDVPGCRDVIDDGANGLLVPPGQPEALAQAILRLMRDAELRRQLGAAARGKVVTDFSADKINRETYDIYRDFTGLS